MAFYQKYDTLPFKRKQKKKEDVGTIFSYRILLARVENRYKKKSGKVIIYSMTPCFQISSCEFFLT